MKVLKFLGYAVAALVGVLVLAAAGVYFVSNGKLHQKFVVAVQAPAIPADPASIAHGRHIAQTRGCVDCHGRDFGGATIVNNGAMGLWSGPNLTRGDGGVIAQFTDADWVRAIRHGVAPDGRGLFLMPSVEYSHFSDEDLTDVIAYIKSRPPVNRATIPLKIGPVARVLLTVGRIKLAAAEIDHAHIAPSTVPKGPTVAYGRYLANGCIGCHNPSFSGGKIEIGPPDWPQAKNLTPAGDLAHWTEADFVRAIRDAKRPDGTELNPVMPRGFGGMDDIELQALYMFFKSLPPVPTGVRNASTVASE